MRRAATFLAVAASLALLAWFAVHFPWASTLRTIARASVPWLVLAAIANLLSLVAKGAAWRKLLQHHAWPRAADAVSATILGAAVGALGPSVAGEAARLRFIVGRGGVTLGGGLATVVAARLLEAVALLAVLSITGGLLPATPWTVALRVAAPGLLAVVVVISRPPVVRWIAGRLPGAAGAVLRRRAAVLSARGTLGALALSALNWVLQWAAYAAACLAVALPHALALGFLALLIANVGGAARLTPGNVGVLQVSFALAAAPLRVDTAGAVAASLLLQAAQVLPVLLVGVAIMASSGRRTAETPA